MPSTTWYGNEPAPAPEATPAAPTEPSRRRYQPSRRIHLDKNRKAYRDAYHQGARHYAAGRLLIHNPYRQHNRRAGWVAGYCDAQETACHRQAGWLARAAFRVRAWIGAK